jgi:hypothetical protein
MRPESLSKEGIGYAKRILRELTLDDLSRQMGTRPGALEGRNPVAADSGRGI